MNAPRTAFAHVFGDQQKETFNRPITHTSSAHQADGADRYAIPKNFDVRSYETNHGTFRRFIFRSSNIVIERQVMEWENIRQALHFLANGGTPTTLVPAHIVQALSEDPVLLPLLGRTPSADPHGVGTLAACCCVWRSGVATAVVLDKANQAQIGWIIGEDWEAETQVAHLTEYVCTTIASRPQHLAKIHKGDAWVCVKPPARRLRG